MWRCVALQPFLYLVVSYLYDGSNRRTSLTQPEGATNYGYDPAGRLSSATDWNIDTTIFSYDMDGRIEQITRPNVESAINCE